MSMISEHSMSRHRSNPVPMSRILRRFLVPVLVMAAIGIAIAPGGALIGGLFGLSVLMQKALVAGLFLSGAALMAL